MTYFADKLGVKRTADRVTNFGEILAWKYPYMTPREAVDTWLHSSSGVPCTDDQTPTRYSKHRELLLCPRWTVMGAGASPLATGTLGTGSPYFMPSNRVVFSVEFIR